MAIVKDERELSTFDDKDEWMLGEDIPEMDLYFAQIWTRSFVNAMENSAGINYRKVLGVNEGLRYHFYYGKEDCHKFTMHVLSKILDTNGEFGDEINRKIRGRSDALVKNAKDTYEKDLSKLPNEDLWHLYKEQYDLHTSLYEYGWLSNATDMFFPEFTGKLLGYLKTKTKDEGEANTYLVILTAPEEETIATKETRDFLEIAIKIQNDAETAALFAKQYDLITQMISPMLREEINAHWKRYRHLKFMYHGVEQSQKEYYEHIKEFMAFGKSASKELLKVEEDFNEKKSRKEKLLLELRVDPFHAHLFKIFGEFMVTKWYRRNSQILALYHIQKLLLEIGKRFKLSIDKVRCILYDEMEKLLSGGEIDPIELSERFKFSVLWVEKGRDFICTGEKARKIAALVERTDFDMDVKELRGQCASLGYAKGRVRITQGAKDLHKMQKGDILVAYATDPDIVPAMKKAGAIITEQGGVTCHAAIVSRELGIPCVIGTKIATKVLKDGEMVEVDATRGIIRRLTK